jgi:hypothetical protein
MTSVAKVLRGKAKTCTKNPNFGKCEGMKEYSQGKLFAFANEVQNWLEENNLTGQQQTLEWDRSDPIYTRKKSDELVGMFIVEALRKAAPTEGVVAEVPKTRKDLDWKKTKPLVLRWIYDNMRPDIEKLLTDALSNGWRAHRYKWANSGRDVTTATCLAGLKEADPILHVFSLTKANLKDGTFRVSSTCSSVVVPDAWKSEEEASAIQRNGINATWSELDEACACRYEDRDAKRKPICKSVRVQVSLDADGNITGGEAKMVKGFVKNQHFGAQNWPEYIMNSTKGAHTHGLPLSMLK